MNEDPDIKKRKRLEKNREAARQARIRRKSRQIEMESRLITLSDENEQLKREVARLKKVISEMGNHDTSQNIDINCERASNIISDPEGSKYGPKTQINSFSACSLGHSNSLICLENGDHNSIEGSLEGSSLSLDNYTSNPSPEQCEKLFNQFLQSSPDA